MLQRHQKPYALQMKGEPGELCLQARALFLERVLSLRPDAVTYLWDRVFPEFKLAVLQHFRGEIFEGIDDPGKYVELRLQEQRKPDSCFVHLLMRKLEALTGASAYSSVDNLSQRPDLAEKVNGVIQEYLRASRESLIVKLMQNKLKPVMGAFDPVRLEFFSWAKIAASEEYNLLTTKIQEWSETWHLNADWCRDHALTVLREWLSDPYLSSVGLDWLERSVQKNGWTSASHDLEYEAILMRVRVDNAVHGPRGPEPFKFQWRRYDFSTPGYNRLKESQGNYKQRALHEFEIHSTDKRRPVLREMLKTGDQESTNGSIELYSEVLKRFTKALNKHVKETMDATAKSTRGLVKTKKKSKLTVHVGWAVEHQVPPVRTLSEIVELEPEDAGSDRSTVNKAVNEVLGLIELEKRQDAKPGRAVGHGRKYPQFMRELGR